MPRGPELRIVLCLALAGLMAVLATSAAAHQRAAEEVVAEVRRATEPYLDIARARADGFVQVSGMEARHGYHFMNINGPMLTAAGMAASALDLARPPMLLYVERAGVWQLAGVEYALAVPPRPNPLPGAEWHRHEASCHYRDYKEAPAPRAADCPPKHPESGEPFVLWHPSFAVAHVWAWIPSPDGPFSEENRALAPYGGTPRPSGHPHPRSETELAYSQVTHRVGGVAPAAVPVVGAFLDRLHSVRALPDSHIRPGVVAVGARDVHGDLHRPPRPAAQAPGPGPAHVRRHRRPAQRRRAGELLLVRSGSDPGDPRRRLAVRPLPRRALPRGRDLPAARGDGRDVDRGRCPDLRGAPHGRGRDADPLGLARAHRRDGADPALLRGALTPSDASRTGGTGDERALTS